MLEVHYLITSWVYHDDGPAFICTDKGVAKRFHTLEQAERHIDKYGLNRDHPIWSVALITELPDKTGNHF